MPVWNSAGRPDRARLRACGLEAACRRDGRLLRQRRVEPLQPDAPEAGAPDFLGTARTGGLFACAHEGDEAAGPAAATHGRAQVAETGEHVAFDDAVIPPVDTAAADDSVSEASGRVQPFKRGIMELVGGNAGHAATNRRLVCSWPR